VKHLSQLLDKGENEVEGLIATATSAATLLVRANNNLVAFAHDGPRTVAYRLIPTERAAGMHADISRFLRQPSFNHDYVFDAADHALVARELGSDTDSDEVVVELLLTSLSRAALAVSLTIATRFFQAVRGIIDESGGYKRWMVDHRDLYIRFLQVYAEISCVSKEFEGCNARVSIVEIPLISDRRMPVFSEDAL